MSLSYRGRPTMRRMQASVSASPQPEVRDLITPEDELVMEALQMARRTLPLAAIRDTMTALALEELRSYDRDWSHPLGFALKS